MAVKSEAPARAASPAAQEAAAMSKKRKTSKKIEEIAEAPDVQELSSRPKKRKTSTKTEELAEKKSPAVEDVSSKSKKRKSATETEEPASPSAEEPSTNPKKRKTSIDEIEVDLTLPEPPSKKAKRALKKGKTLPAKKDSDNEEDSEKEDAGKEKKAKKERSEWGVWIGNLRFTVTKEELRKWFVDNSGGSITEESITRVHLPSSKNKGARKEEKFKKGDKMPFENKGYAYVDFSTFEANVAAIALSETEWYRRKVLIKDNKSYEGRPKKEAEESAVVVDGETVTPAAAAPVSTSRKIFVGNLGFQTTEDDLWAQFEKCGEIDWVKVATFEDTGKCKGYGWVKFKAPEAADWAVKGFVKIKEVEETEEDFMDVDEDEAEKEKDDDSEEEADDSDDGGEEALTKIARKAAKQQKPEKKVKMRKWWVNMLRGRTLKLEHAEDDQTRYKKRYTGKGAREQRERRAPRGPPGGPPRRHDNQPRPAYDDSGAASAAPAEPVTREVKQFEQDISVARLTGAPVASTGKKTKFE